MKNGQRNEINANKVSVGKSHHEAPVHMNIKKIRRLMKKYAIFGSRRKSNPYRRIAKALKTSNVPPKEYYKYLITEKYPLIIPKVQGKNDD